MLAVKAHQVAGAAAWLERLCGAFTHVAVLQNGVEQRELVEPLARGGAIVPAIVWLPAEMVGPGRVLVRGEARLSVPDDDGGRGLVRLYEGTSARVQPVPDFVSEAWRKLCGNAVAGLMVLALRRADMFRRDDVAELSRRLALECLAVARAEGADIPDSFADDLVDNFKTYPPDLGTSMLFDREAGRELEWEARNGVIKRLGELHGIPTPVSDVIVPLLAAASEAGRPSSSSSSTSSSVSPLWDSVRTSRVGSARTRAQASQSSSRKSSIQAAARPRAYSSIASNLPVGRAEHRPAVEAQHRQLARRSRLEEVRQVLVRLLLPAGGPDDLIALSRAVSARSPQASSMQCTTPSIQ